MSDYEGFAGRVDVRHLLTWCGAIVAGLLIPARWSDRVIGARLRNRELRNPDRILLLANLMEDYLGPAPGADYLTEARSYEYRLAELQWGRVRDLTGRRWPITTTVHGLDQVESGRRDSRGVVLWHMSFGGTGVLPAKMALAREGIEYVHLTRAQHGIGRDTWVAVRMIGPLYTRTEDRYVHERIAIPLDDSLGYMRTLIERLEAGAVLTVMGEESGRRMVAVPFLRGERGFASGSPALAHKTGAVLLPVHAVRTGELEYAVHIESPIDVDYSLPRRQFVTAAINEYAARLGDVIRAHPSDWDGWRKRRDPPTPTER